MKLLKSSKKILSICFACSFIAAVTKAQDNVGIGTNTPNPSAILELLSTNKGMLVPRMSTAGMIAIASPANSLLVYNTDSMCYFFYRLPNTTWISLCHSGSGGSGTTGATGATGTAGATGTSGATGSTGPAGADLGTHWTITGNAGTTAGTNFIGTTDAQDFVTKTNGALPANERMRVLSGGNVIVNNTTIGTNTTDVFSVYSDATTNGTTTNISTLGGFAINGYSSGTGTGVYGENSAAGNGVYGNSTTTGNGVYGVNNGAGIGVYGLNSAVKIGVEGDVYNLIPQAIATGTSMGVFGYNNSIPGPSAFAVGVLGSSVSTTGPTDGVYGRAASPDGFGTDGYNSNTSGTGMIGIGNGTRGSYLISGSGGAFTGNTTGIYGHDTAAGVGEALYMSDNFGAFWDGGYYDGLTYWKITGNGLVSTVVPDMSDKNVLLICPESPEALFTDYGNGQLKNGFAHIELDPVLVKNITVNDKHMLRVFIQLEDNEKCKGVIVKNKTAKSFDVMELDGGSSNTPFTYQITANRSDQQMEKGRTAHYADLRFPGAAKRLEERSLNSPVVTTGNEQKKSKLKKIFSK